MERTLTPKGAATRQRIVEQASRIVRLQGVAHTSLDDIGEAAKASRSQLFHYFPDGRDQLLLEVLRHEASRVLSDQQPHLGALTSWDAWGAWRDLVIERYRNQGQSCPMSVLVSQLGGGAREAATAVSAELLRTWQSSIADGIRAMQARGEIDGSIDPEVASGTILAAIQGGVVIMLATGDLGHLTAALDAGIAALR